MSVLRWPLPALLTWLGGWAVFTLGQRAGLAPLPALAASVLACAVAAWCLAAGWRRAVVALGFPLALALQQLPAPGLWAAGGLVLLLLLYPPRAWRDAPLFPTPRGALEGLTDRLGLKPGLRVLDAGCGTGDALLELARALPQAALHGIEGSGLLRLAARWRLGGRARIEGGDLWRQSWADFDLVYLFQRPESMPGAWRKAQEEMAPGAWLVSLDFAVPDLMADRQWTGASGRPVYAYSIRKGRPNPAN